MSKKVILLLALVALVGFGAYYLLGRSSIPGVYARYLPPDTVATVNLTHAATLADGFANSPLGRLLAKETVHAIISELGGQAKESAEYDQMVDSVSQVIKDPAFRTVFGEDATLALLPPDPALLATAPQTALRGAAVVVAQTSAAGALDMLSRLMKNAQVSRETVDGLELTKITLQGDQVLYGLTEGKTVFLGYSPKTIGRCLAIGKDNNGLDKAPGFKAAAAFWQAAPDKTTYSRVYVNLASAAGLLKTAVNPQVKEIGTLLQGMDSMATVNYGDGQNLESRGQSTYVYEQLHPMVKSAVDAAGANSTLSLIKEQSMAYNWASSLRPEMFAQVMGADPKSYQELDQASQRNLHVSLAELGRAFGPQYGGVLDDIVQTPLFPMPKLTLFFSVKERAIAQTALDNLRKLIAASGMASEMQEQVAGQTIAYWPVMPGTVEPGMVLTDNMLYVATDRASLANLLKAPSTGAGLAAPVAGQLGTELSQRVAAANFGCLVLYPRRMAQQTGKSLEWLAAILASAKQVSMARLNHEVVQLLESAELMAATSNLEKTKAQWTMTIRMAAAKPAAGGN